MEVEKQHLKQKILFSALEIVPFDGWYNDIIESACKRIHLPIQYADIFFPDGTVELVKFFCSYVDDLMLEEVLKTNVNITKIHEKIILAIKIRFDILSKHKTSITKMISYLSLPWNVLNGATIFWDTADIIWSYVVGDSSTDFNYYTKRAVLSIIYRATLLYWISDDSKSHHKTLAFLTRKIKKHRRVKKQK